MMESRWNPNGFLIFVTLEVLGDIEQSFLNENTSTWQSCDYDEKITNALVHSHLLVVSNM